MLSYHEVEIMLADLFAEHGKQFEVVVFPAWQQYALYDTEVVANAYSKAGLELLDAGESHSTKFPDGKVQGRCFKYSMALAAKMYSALPGVPVLQVSGRSVEDAPTGGHRFILILTEDGLYPPGNEGLLDEYKYFVDGVL